MRSIHLAAFLLAASSFDTQARRLGQIDFETCTLTSPGAPSTLQAKCARVEVPENRDAPDKRLLSLALAWLPASVQAEADPVFFLSGGPGQGAREAYLQVAPAFADVNRYRDVILIDQRGTGDSNPLNCLDEQGQNNFSDPQNETLQAAQDFAKKCLTELSKKADVRFYTTGDAIADLDAVRTAIGANKINLIGVSYGTRVAQQYAKTFPAHTRTVLLDSVVPNTLVLGSEHAGNLQAALTTQFERCRIDSACKKNLGDPEKKLANILTSFTEKIKPVTSEKSQTDQTVSITPKDSALASVSYRDAISGQWKTAIPSRGHLTALLRLYSYLPQTASTLPLLIQQISEGQWASVMAQADQLMSNVGGQIAHGMQLSVSCTEDVDELKVNPDDVGTLFGTEFVEFTKAQCDIWPRGKRAENFREPLTGNLPVLAISGQYDPVTPPRYGDSVIEKLDNARHLILKGQGHSVLMAGCMPKLFAQFVELADTKSLNASCLDRLRAPPPFAGLYGWEP